MVKLVATRELRYAAKQYNVGDHFDASEKDARILKGIKKAEDAPAVVTETPPRAPLPARTARVAPPAPVPPVPAPTPEPPAAPVVKAEEPAQEAAKAPEPAAPAKEEVVAETSLPKAEAGTPTSTTTRYRRRDLQAQE